MNTSRRSRPVRRHLAPIAVALAAAFSLAACGDDDDTARSGPSSTAQNANAANTPGGTSNAQSGQNPADSSAAVGTSRPSTSSTGNSGATMSGNVAGNPSPGTGTGVGAAANGAAASTNNAAGNLVASAAGATGAATAASKGAKADPKSAIGTTERRFIAHAASAGMMEVEAGKLAQERGQSAAVKQFGQMLEQDHTQANNELIQLATSKGVEVPRQMDKEHQAKLDKLRKAKADEFDRMFIEQVGRADHRKDIADFERAVRESNDADVRGFAQKTLPVLKKHHEQAQQLAQAGGKGAGKDAGSNTATGSPGGAGRGGTGGASSSSNPAGAGK